MENGERLPVSAEVDHILDDLHAPSPAEPVLHVGIASNSTDALKAFTIGVQSARLRCHWKSVALPNPVDPIEFTERWGHEAVVDAFPAAHDHRYGIVIELSEPNGCRCERRAALCGKSLHGDHAFPRRPKSIPEEPRGHQQRSCKMICLDLESIARSEASA